MTCIETKKPFYLNNNANVNSVYCVNCPSGIFNERKTNTSYHIISKFTGKEGANIVGIVYLQCRSILQEKIVIFTRHCTRIHFDVIHWKYFTPCGCRFLLCSLVNLQCCGSQYRLLHPQGITVDPENLSKFEKFWPGFEPWTFVVTF